MVLGLGAREQADLVHVFWPDGVMQCELNQVSDPLVDLAENNRKTGSCPVLFAWNGRRNVCVGDFLGGGGMGYLVGPASIASRTATRRWPSRPSSLGKQRRLPALDQRADGRDRVSGSLDARRGRPAAWRSRGPGRAVCPGGAAADGGAFGAGGRRSSPIQRRPT